MSRDNRVASSALMISLCTLVSKGLGFLRVVLIASRFGSGMETDTYNAAMTATVVIVGALGSALNTTLVPIFTKIDERHGRKGKLRFLNNIINLVLVLTLAMIILGFFASPLIIRMAAKGFQGDQFRLAVSLNRIGLPIIMLLGFIHILSGFLHSSKIFGPPALAGIPYNIVFMVYLIFFAASPNIKTLMVVTVIGTLFQLLIHLPAVFYQGYRFRPGIDLRDRYLRETMILVGPILIGSAVQQINIIIDKTLSSELATGSLSALDYAYKINDMVVAVFVMGITTVVFPMISEAFAKEDLDSMLSIFTRGVNIILLIVVPATFGILILSKPAVRLFFERGAFTTRDTDMTSLALRMYSLGIIGSSLRLMLNRVFYSFQDPVTPMVNGIVAVVINIGLNFVLIRYLDHGGLALATSISATVTTILLFIKLRKKLGGLDISGHINCLLKTLIASIIMGFVVVLVYFRLGSLLDYSRLVDLIFFLASILLGVLTYGGLCKALGIEEFDLLLGKLKGKLRK